MIYNTDSYKFSHFQAYPKGTQYIYSYAQSRGGKYNQLVFTGMTRFIKQYLLKPITREDVTKAKDFSLLHGVPFNKQGWEIILNQYNGYIPVEIRAVPQGTVMSPHNVMATVENTDPRLAWLTSYIQTLLIQIWYPITVASRILAMKKAILPYYKQTSDNLDAVPFSLLDFSARGCSSLQSAKIGGSSYLLHFMGSDNVPAINDVIQNYKDAVMPGFSIPATQHSVMTSYGQQNQEQSFLYLLNNAVEQGGTLSVVCDSWDIYTAARTWSKLANKVKQRQVTLVVRPDSGSISQVVPKVLQILQSGFGSTTNSKGYRVLNNVKVLWGDGINQDTVTQVFKIAKNMGISADSVLTGSGGGLMQSNIDRDTCKFAFKASGVTINGVFKGISKKPITDPGKNSKQGYLSLYKVLGSFVTAEKDSQDFQDLLEPVYRNGKLLRDPSWLDIKSRIEKSL